MKPEKIHDAMNFIDDELIETADKLRHSQKSTRIKTTRILALAAAVLVVFTGVLVFARSISFDITSDSAANDDGNDIPTNTNKTNGSTDLPDNADDCGGNAPPPSSADDYALFKTGADVLYGVLGIDKGYSSVSLKYLKGDGIPTKQYHEVIDSLIKEISTSPVTAPTKTELSGKYVAAVINIKTNDGTEFGIHLHDGAYAVIIWGKVDNVSIKLDETVFNSYLSKLGYTDFDQAGFVANIPTPPNERFAFYHKIFPTSVYLYFYTDAHYWPDGYTPDKSSIKAYIYGTSNPDNGIGTVTFPLPEDFDLSYDGVTPIYANGGGGSSECMVVFRFDYGLESVFVEFNNFAYTDDILAFEYAGELEEEAVKTALIDAQSKLNPEIYHEGGQK